MSENEQEITGKIEALFRRAGKDRQESAWQDRKSRQEIRPAQFYGATISLTEQTGAETI
jgi:hypothetical protein